MKDESGKSLIEFLLAGILIILLVILGILIYRIKINYKLEGNLDNSENNIVKIENEYDLAVLPKK